MRPINPHPRRGPVLSVALLLLAGCAVDPSGLGEGAPPEDAGPYDGFGGDLCPDDPLKVSPGICGCGIPDTDTDGDGRSDCNDGCPDDPSKVAPEICGCGESESDDDLDGTPSCNDCDDDDDTRFPGATELCDGVDQDCDSVVDEEVDCAEPGCSDGTREGFEDSSSYPLIAACEGAWTALGAFGDGVPSCGRAAGNDGTNSAGSGCDVDDLCQEGWRPCDSPAAVAERSSSGCSDAVGADAPPTFYVASVAGDGGGECASSGIDGVFGCGNAGDEPAASCAPLNRTLNRPCALFDGDPAWNCDGHIAREAQLLNKSVVAHGGVLCCSYE